LSKQDSQEQRKLYKQESQAQRELIQAVLGDAKEQRELYKQESQAQRELMQAVVGDAKEQRELYKQESQAQRELLQAVLGEAKQQRELIAKLVVLLTPSHTPAPVPVTEGAAIAPVSQASTHSMMAAVDLPVASSTGRECECLMDRNSSTPSKQRQRDWERASKSWDSTGRIRTNKSKTLGEQHPSKTDG
jgi:hypothetical protein